MRRQKAASGRNPYSYVAHHSGFIDWPGSLGMKFT